jgi:hypothetical protein
VFGVRVPCPDAPAGAVPDVPFSKNLGPAPALGTYTRRNDGTLKVSLASLSATLPYPKQTTFEVRNVTDVIGPPDLLGNPGARSVTFDLYEPLGDGSTLTSYVVSPTAISLKTRVTKLGDKTVTFTPTPMIDIVHLGGNPGDTWNSAGVDLDNRTSGLVQGRIVTREFVNVCGRVVDTYRVQASERYVSLDGSGAYSSSTKDTAVSPGSTETGLPNFYNIAPQFGPLFVAVETHTTTTVAPIVIDIDNVGTMNSMEPKSK